MTNITESTLVEEGAIPPTDFHDQIERIREISDYEIEYPPDLDARIQAATEGLLVDPEIVKAAIAAIKVGHLILQGPPGTGKSSLARALCEAFHASVLPVTAHEDWTVFDVIGRLELRLSTDRKEEIVPVNGFFTEAVIRCANTTVKHFDEEEEPQAEWLLIDELNRAHLDKSFGELFTVLGTDALIPITLPHQKEGNRNLVIPRRFRIVATLNSYDRQFVNGLSQAIRRRFTFLTLNIPPKRPEGIGWNDDPPTVPMALQELRVVIDRVASRVAKRMTSSDPKKWEEKRKELFTLLNAMHPSIEALFTLIERIRYVGPTDKTPHLPIGTAQIIDTVELFLVRMLQEGLPNDQVNDILDWACSVKIVPLFDADVIAPDLLKEFAESIGEPFNKATRRELLSIVAAGMHFVE